MVVSLFRLPVAPCRSRSAETPTDGIADFVRSGALARRSGAGLVDGDHAEFHLAVLDESADGEEQVLDRHGVHRRPASAPASRLLLNLVTWPHAKLLTP